ncbi:MAG TPA: hypothetical protein VIJ81_09805 [Sphingomicrobium sp.]|jgi:gas vesicle protein
MRKFLISAAVAMSALTAAVPAAAQYAPQYYGHGNYNQSRQLLNRIERVKDQINILDRRDILSNREADYLKGQANDLRRIVKRIDNNGIDRRERATVERRIADLEIRVQREARDGNRHADRRW